MTGRGALRSVEDWFVVRQPAHSILPARVPIRIEGTGGTPVLDGREMTAHFGPERVQPGLDGVRRERLAAPKDSLVIP